MAEKDSTSTLENEEKHGLNIADFVRMGVLAWSATLLTISYLNVIPSMKMDSTFVASLLTGAMAGFGIERKAPNKKREPSKVETNDLVK